MSKPRRKFTSEFKAEVVALCRAGDRSIAQIARDLGLEEPIDPSLGQEGQRWPKGQQRDVIGAAELERA